MLMPIAGYVTEELKNSRLFDTLLGDTEVNIALPNDGASHKPSLTL